MQLSITPRFDESPVGIIGKINERQQLKEGGPDEQRTPLPAWGQVTHTRGCSNNDEGVQQVHLQGNHGLSCTNLLDQAHWLQCAFNPPGPGTLAAVWIHSKPPCDDNMGCTVLSVHGCTDSAQIQIDDNTYNLLTLFSKSIKLKNRIIVY